LEKIKKILKALGIYSLVINLYDSWVFKKEFKGLTTLIKQTDFDKSPIFFFPYYHTGGAEKVHLNIVSAISDKQCFTFFSKTSYNNQFLDDFKKNSNVFLITKFLKNPKSKQKLVQLLLNKLSKSSLVFGSNNEFFYEMVSQFNDDLKKIDLLHAFVYPDNENASEHYSLPVVDRLTTRIVINKKTEKDLFDQYAVNNVSSKLQNRISTIYNGVEIAKDVKDKSEDSILNVLYVGRNTQEKRVHLIARIAKELEDFKDIKFRAIGADLAHFFSNSTNVLATGVKQGGELELEYQRANILLLTSKREGFPLVLSEAMTNNMACISTAVGGIPFLLESDENCFLVNPENEDTIVAFMVEKLNLLRTDRSKLKMITEKGRIKINETFAYDNFVKKYRDLLLK
jgi:glycosyltransferase involved in cell wall biosynthesis